MAGREKMSSKAPLKPVSCQEICTHLDMLCVLWFSCWIYFWCLFAKNIKWRIVCSWSRIVNLISRVILCYLWFYPHHNYCEEVLWDADSSISVITSKEQNDLIGSVEMVGLRLFAGLQGFLTQSNTFNCMTRSHEGHCRWEDRQTASPVRDLWSVDDQRRDLSLRVHP